VTASIPFVCVDFEIFEMEGKYEADVIATIWQLERNSFSLEETPL
jgi:hypothetical protein